MSKKNLSCVDSNHTLLDSEVSEGTWESAKGHIRTVKLR